VTSVDWFESGIVTGLAAAWTAFRLGRHQRDRRRSQPTGLPERTFADGARQLGEQLDRQASSRATPCPACSRADQAGLAPAEQHPACADKEPK